MATIKILVFLLSTFLISQGQRIPCTGDGDCPKDQVCSSDNAAQGSCLERVPYGKTCIVSRQCLGFNLQCQLNSCSCRRMFDYDSGNCKYVGPCRREYDCGVGYYCGSDQRCYLKQSGRSGLSGGAIAGIVIGVLIAVAIIVGVVLFVLNKRITYERK